MSNEKPASGNDAKLKRDIGMLGAGFLVLNGLIGAGIYGLPSKLFEQAGMFSPWLFIIAGAFMIMVVWTFAALASYFTNTGGPVVYASSGFGPLVGFQTGWLLYMGRVTAIAANVNVLVNYLAYVWEDASGEGIKIMLIFLIIGGLAVINILGIKKAVHAINILTFLKIVPLIILLLLGFQYFSPEVFLPTEFPKIDNVGATALLILYTFVGFEGALVTAGETKNPKKTLPRALITTVLLITALYFIIQMVYISVEPTSNDSVPLVTLGNLLMGPIGAVVIIFTAVFSIMGNAASIVIAAPRMTFALAEDGSLPKWFSKIHKKYNTPANSIIFLAVFSFLLAISGTFVFLAVASALSRMLAYSVCILALPIIRKKADPETRKNATTLPGGYLIPGIALVICLLAATQSTMNSWKYLIGFIVFGSLLYFINSKFNKAPSE